MCALNSQRYDILLIPDFRSKDNLMTKRHEIFHKGNYLDLKVGKLN